MRKNLAKISELAWEKLLEVSDHQKCQYDIRSNTKSYRQGDKVFVFDPSERKGISPKLQCLLSDPFEVVEKLSHLLYRVKFTNKVKILHHDRLKLCYRNAQMQNQNSKVKDNLLGEIVESDHSDDKAVERNTTGNVSTGVPSVRTRSDINVKLPKK